MTEKPEWYVRLCEEKDELQDRIHKLSNHLASSGRINKTHDMLLPLQLDAMLSYRNILSRRIMEGYKEDE